MKKTIEIQVDIIEGEVVLLHDFFDAEHVVKILKKCIDHLKENENEQNTKGTN